MAERDADRTAALKDLRAAEAARILGLLDTSTLAARAGRWVQQGLSSTATLELAATGDGAGGPQSPLVLLATVASEHGISIPDVGVARAVHAESIIGLAGAGGDISESLFDLSNSVTDGVTGGLRRWWRDRRR